MVGQMRGLTVSATSTIVRGVQLLPVDNKENAEAGIRRATKEALRYANLCYQALDAAYGAG
jgi:hypothetical protein